MRNLSKTRVAASAIGIFAGLGGASHGLGEMLQGNVAPSGILIKAWPELTALGGEPAMTIVPSFLVASVLTIIFGIIVAAWAGAFIKRKNGGLMLILLSVVMLLVGGGIVPPLFGAAAGVISLLINHSAAHSTEMLTHD
jgi:hypothetical protein